MIARICEGLNLFKRGARLYDARYVVQDSTLRYRNVVIIYRHVLMEALKLTEINVALWCLCLLSMCIPYVRLDSS